LIIGSIIHRTKINPGNIAALNKKTPDEISSGVFNPSWND